MAGISSHVRDMDTDSLPTEAGVVRGASGVAVHSFRRRKRLTYARQLFLWLLGYSVLLVGSLVVFQYHREKDFKKDEVNTQLQLINRFILARLEAGADIADVMCQKPAFSDVGSGGFEPFSNLRVSILDKNGIILYDNTLKHLPTQSHLNREEVRNALKKGSGYAVYRHSESTGGTYFYSATSSGNGIIVRTAIPYSLSLTTLLRADYGFLWVMGIVTVVMFVLGYFATRRVGLHIARLNHFAESAERGMKISDVEPFPHDELGDISNHIVRLYASLQQANADRDREHRAALHEHEEKVRIKKQLTNNINHELKTPVASIRVCLETMLAHPDIDERKSREFLERSLANVDRLSRLLADVSIITRMDDGKSAISREALCINDIIADVISDKSAEAAAAGMTIKCDLSDKLMVNGNPALIASIFNNLVDNAVAYSGASDIEIRGGICGREIIITVSDNGSGVAPEHLPHLFERFYRIDKGRSRAAGGTGLGLSIVKNAVLFHGGCITASNRPGGGLAFRIEMPV